MKKVQLNSAKLKLKKEQIATLSAEQVQVVKGGDNNVIIDNSTQQNFLSLFACKTHQAPYCCPPPPVISPVGPVAVV